MPNPALQGEILDSAHEFVVQLADIFDYVTPCFPEKYGIFKVIFQEYHQHMSFMLDCIGCCADQLANSDILKVPCSACHPQLQQLPGVMHLALYQIRDAAAHILLILSRILLAKRGRSCIANPLIGGLRG